MVRHEEAFDLVQPYAALDGGCGRPVLRAIDGDYHEAPPARVVVERHHDAAWGDVELDINDALVQMCVIICGRCIYLYALIYFRSLYVFICVRCVNLCLYVV